MKTNYLNIAAVSLCLLLTSCYQRMYFPDRANTPGLSRALEGKATFSLKPQIAGNDSSGDPNFSAGADLAFSPINHLGIIASYQQLINKNVKGEVDNSFSGLDEHMKGRFNGQRWEIGAGLYETFGASGKAEIYAGYGNGSVQRRNPESPEYDYNVRYHRFFLQPALGFGKINMFSFTGGVRLAFMKFYGLKPINVTAPLSEDWPEQQATNSIRPYMEPFLNIECGYKYAKANVQLGFSQQFMGKLANVPYFSFGLLFHFVPSF